MVLGFDPLQSEPKPKKKIKKSQNGYSCSQCEYIASKASHLKKHVESKHEGVRYHCLLCEYVATLESVLKRHVKIKDFFVLSVSMLQLEQML